MIGNTVIFGFSVHRIEIKFLINIKYVTVTWLFKISTFMWVILSCPWVRLFT